MLPVPEFKPPMPDWLSPVSPIPRLLVPVLPQTRCCPGPCWPSRRCRCRRCPARYCPCRPGPPPDPNSRTRSWHRRYCRTRRCRRRHVAEAQVHVANVAESQVHVANVGRTQVEVADVAEADVAVADVSQPDVDDGDGVLPHVGGQQARQVITDVAQARHQRRRPKRQRAGVVDPRQPRTEVEHAGVQCADVGNTRTRACQSGVRLVPPPRHVRAEVAETRAPARPGVEEARRRNGGGVPNARGGRDVDQRDDQRDVSPAMT